MMTANATIVGIATTESVLASVKGTGAQTIDDQLQELSSRFIEAAKVIDPTIKGAWVGSDADDNPEGGRLYFIHLERANRPFVRKGRVA